MYDVLKIMKRARANILSGCQLQEAMMCEKNKLRKRNEGRAGGGVGLCRPQRQMGGGR